MTAGNFRPLFGDLSSIPRWYVIIKNVNAFSVPSSGTYLPFLTLQERTKKEYDFPSPLRGLIFHFVTFAKPKKEAVFSVPSSGTYLPFSLSSQSSIFPTLLIRFAWEKKISFIFMVTLLLKLIQSTVFRYARETLKNLQFALSKLIQFSLIFRTF